MWIVFSLRTSSMTPKREQRRLDGLRHIQNRRNHGSFCS